MDLPSLPSWSSYVAGALVAYAVFSSSIDNIWKWTSLACVAVMVYNHYLLTAVDVKKNPLAQVIKTVRPNDDVRFDGRYGVLPGPNPVKEPPHFLPRPEVVDDQFLDKFIKNKELFSDEDEGGAS